MESLKKHIGDLGEELACRYLKSKDFTILDKNFTKVWSGAEKCEIDIIAKHTDIIHFVEVKTIRPVADNHFSEFFSAFSKVNFLKKRKIEKTAEYWISKNKLKLDAKYQLDVIAVKISRDFSSAKIKMIDNI